MLYVYTGNGKGKTTAAFGQALRAVGHNFKVLIIQFGKGANFEYGEITSAKLLSPNLKIEQYGTDSFIDPLNPSNEAKEMAVKGWEASLKALSSNDYDIIILDELNIMLDFNLLDKNDVIQALNGRNKELNVIITGRNAPKEIIDIADMVSEIKMVKHPYTKGIDAIKGIEY